MSHPDPIDERLREIRERWVTLHQWPGTDVAAREAITFLLDLITSLREEGKALRRVVDVLPRRYLFAAYTIPKEWSITTRLTQAEDALDALDALDATHRPPLSGET